MTNSVCRKWRPSNRVEALEEEHNSHIAVHEAFGSAVWVISVLLGKTSDDEEANDKETLGENSSWFAAPFCCKVSPSKTAAQAPYV
jgi:hypothetical protein